MVATTTEDPVTEPQSAPDTSGTTNGAAAPKGEAHPNDLKTELMAVQIETGTANQSAPDVPKATNGEAATKGKPDI